MRNKLTVALAGGALATGAFVGQASAQQFPADTGNFNYNYVEGGLAFVDQDWGDQDLVGPVVRGSTAFHPNVFANAELSYLTDDVDITTFRAGPGARMAVTPAFDAYGMLRVAYQDFDPGDDDTGYDVTVGFRSDVAPMFEVGGEIRYTDIDDDDATDFILRGLYEMTPQAELLGELHALDDGDDAFEDFGALVGARYNF